MLIFRLDKELERVETASGQGGIWPPEEERYRARGGGKALGPLEPEGCSRALSSTQDPTGWEVVVHRTHLLSIVMELGMTSRA